MKTATEAIQFIDQNASHIPMSREGHFALMQIINKAKEMASKAEAPKEGAEGHV